MQIANNQASNGQNSLAQENLHRKVVLLRIKQVQARIGLGRSSIYALADKNGSHYDPSFPRSIKISTHAVGWIESEVEMWLESRIKFSRNQDAQRS